MTTFYPYNALSELLNLKPPLLMLDCLLVDRGNCRVSGGELLSINEPFSPGASLLIRLCLACCNRRHGLGQRRALNIRWRRAGCLLCAGSSSAGAAGHESATGLTKHVRGVSFESNATSMNSWPPAAHSTWLQQEDWLH